MATYAADGRLESSDIRFKLVLKSKKPLSLFEYGEVFRDIDNIFKISTRETSSRIRGSNGRIREAALVVEDFKSGSLEIFANPYFQGVVSSTAASAIVAIFAYVLRRVDGKPDNADQEPTHEIPNTVMTEEKVREAASEAVSATAQPRKRIKNKKRAFSLEISVTFNNRTYTS